jgi:hypothetical protein
LAPPASDTAPFVAGASLTATLQQAEAAGADTGRQQRRAAYRGDVSAILHAPAPAGGRGSVFGHVRFGQGEGIATRPTYTGAVDSVAFEQSRGSSFAVLAQVFYHVDLPLPPGHGDSTARIALTAGKMDPFMFFDQNDVSDDETSGFLNNVFVHNPLLDSGGDIGGDRYGFTPGVRVAWSSHARHTLLGASVGIFGAGRGAEFRSSPGRPLVLAQVEMGPARVDGGPAGHYRLYAWMNPQAMGLDGRPAEHAGWGVSIDQQIGKDLTVFGRLGRRTRGQGRFDQASTVGAEWGGTAWRRPGDGIAVALGWLPTGDGNRLPRAGEASGGASGAEKILEIFYRYALTREIEISPDFQLVRRAAGDPSAPQARFFGVRVKLGF